MVDYQDKILSLTPNSERILCQKMTERPTPSSQSNIKGRGSFLCRRCGLALFRGQSQFHSGTGWPSFDETITDAVLEVTDADGHRVEIVCQRCHGHLGHVFRDEFFTANNCRHCVNAAAIDWVDSDSVNDSEEAILAGGCFWGVEHYLRQLPGVIKVESGYTGGVTTNPTYNEICQGSTEHLEAVRVVFDTNKTTYQAVVKHFFEIHDPTQANGQGPDLGSQYRSAIFYFDDQQLCQAQQLIELLKDKGFAVKTVLRPVEVFWPAEDYHQQYYEKHQKSPYCHRITPRFG